ncbi:hypothetical protein Poli38472_004471 [Pythium oligandrum]|uniref:Rhodanese domain-containing protein n=1 Tax=Pythium oligandrum TaxID=41045 RepID=A0A8K1FH59_PYTOL|nr:hypothetical protein Poli38472_004471 [Pythium oligandrum]|eukprot:TMW59402.1 hypothetical protein Poli38472_004471 [Pythium oligandrum]
MAPNDHGAALDAASALFTVVLYYKYVRIAETEEQLTAFVQEHEALCASLELTGRVRIALEGINGTLGGTDANIHAYVRHMQQSTLFQDVDWKLSASSVSPFPELQVRRVQEIVALVLPDEQCDPSNGGVHLTPEEFHQEQENCAPEDYALIDVRNDYEYNIGHFQGAMNPKTRCFRNFPEWVRTELPVLQEKQKILMYCTGGIRCEKASAYLKHLGLENVYQLQGGIHRYLERFPDGGRFQGKNFVFDQRVAMASTDPSVAGKCDQCATPYDVVSGVRCVYCRTHVLLCDACRGHTSEEDVYCKDHVALVDGSLEELQAKAQELMSQSENEKGQARKKKRRALRKQLDIVQARIQALCTE